MKTVSVEVECCFCKTLFTANGEIPDESDRKGAIWKHVDNFESQCENPGCRQIVKVFLTVPPHSRAPLGL